MTLNALKADTVRADKVRVGMVGLGLVAAGAPQGLRQPRLGAGGRRVRPRPRARRALRRRAPHSRGVYRYDEMLARPRHQHRGYRHAHLSARAHDRRRPPWRASTCTARSRSAAAWAKGAGGQSPPCARRASSWWSARRMCLSLAHEGARAASRRGRSGGPCRCASATAPGWSASRARSLHRPPDRNWRVDPVKSGGGDYPWIYDHAVHFFATAEYLMLGRAHRRGLCRCAAATARCRVQERRRPRSLYHRRGGYPHHHLDLRRPGLPGRLDAGRAAERQVRLYARFQHDHLWRDRDDRGVGRGRPQPALGGPAAAPASCTAQGKRPVCFRFDEGGDDVWESDICYYSQGHINQVHHLDRLHPERPGAALHRATMACTPCNAPWRRSPQRSEGRPVKLSEIEPRLDRLRRPYSSVRATPLRRPAGTSLSGAR